MSYTNWQVCYCIINRQVPLSYTDLQVCYCIINHQVPYVIYWLTSLLMFYKSPSSHVVNWLASFVLFYNSPCTLCQILTVKFYCVINHHVSDVIYWFYYNSTHFLCLLLFDRCYCTKIHHLLYPKTGCQMLLYFKLPCTHCPIDPKVMIYTNIMLLFFR